MPAKNVYMTAETISQLKRIEEKHGDSHSKSIRHAVADYAPKKLKQTKKKETESK